MSAHTPGPWRASEEEPYWLRIVTAEDRGIAEVYMEDAPNEDYNKDYNAEQRANAHVLAAAPELIQALRDIAVRFHADGLMRQNGTHFRHSGNSDECDELWCSQARAAIAKATGGQQ